jgi:hypothetical protein
MQVGALSTTLPSVMRDWGGGTRRLMDVLDLSVDYAADPLTTWTLYLAKAWGKGAVRANFVGTNATYAYLELQRRW